VFDRGPWGPDLVVRQAHHEVLTQSPLALMVSLSNHEAWRQPIAVRAMLGNSTGLPLSASATFSSRAASENGLGTTS